MPPVQNMATRLCSRGVELVADEVLELAEARDARIDRPGEGAHPDLEIVARIEQHDAGLVHEPVPLVRRHIGPHPAQRIGLGIAEGHDLLLEAHLHALERHLGGNGVLQLEIVETSREEQAGPQFRHEGIDGLVTPGDGAVDPFMRKQERAADPEILAQPVKRLLQLAEIGQRDELIEGGNLVRHGGCLSARARTGNPFPRIVGVARTAHCHRRLSR